jgi:hypothetical protein
VSEHTWDSPVSLSREKKKPRAAFFLESGYHEHAGSLLLLAAANETTLVTHLAEALPSEQAVKAGGTLLFTQSKLGIMPRFPNRHLLVEAI